MKQPWIMFTGICSIVLAIVMFSVVAGGYTSFLRSQSRIKKSAEFLAQADQKRVELIEDLLEYHPSSKIPNSADSMAALLKKAITLRETLKQPERLKDQNTITRFVENQEQITTKLIPLIEKKLSFDTQEEQNVYTAKIREIYQAQDNLFVVRKRYDHETNYFNTRTRVFPNFLIARLFGFDEITYFGVGQEQLLPSHKVFPEKP